MASTRLRIGAFVAVAAGHAALFIVLATMHLTVTPTTDLETSMILFTLPSKDATPQQAPLPTRPERARSMQHARPPEAAVHPRDQAPERTQSSAPVAIDWAKEAERAAARQIDEDEVAARRAAALSAHTKAPSSLAPLPPPPPQFGWSHAATHRLESFPGGMILNLTDRCAIVFSIMLIPVCKVGDMEPRGDLLEHMDDPPPLGAPPTDLP
jgi:hypothetical protein